MPLEDFLPEIDNRRYDDIMAEIRSRIARYTPEWKPVWSDVNDSDPGITMVQVFAWLSEMLLFRMGKVPELNYLKFLQLIGIELRSAAPARAEIHFPVKKTETEPYVLVPGRTQVSGESAEGPVVFETDRDLFALTARLAELQSYDGYAYSLLDNELAEDSPGFEPFGPLAKQDSALLLGFDYDGSFPARTELDLAVWVYAEIGADSYQCGQPASRSDGIAWEYWDGSEWGALSLLRDDTRRMTRSGHITLMTPAKGALQKGLLGKAEASRYWIRARLEREIYEKAPRLLAVKTNTVAATQAETIADEVLGGSDGSPNQIFRVENTPVLNDSLVLEVDEGEGYATWTRVDDFFGSGPRDPHYTLNRTTGEIRFGDGRQGAIPVGNVDNPGANVVARGYRFGGGQKGNLAAGTLKTPLTALSGIDTASVTNPVAAFGGREEETLQEAKRRAPRALANKDRAVTSEDFETLAQQAADIKRARALPLYHPDFPEVKVPGVMTVVVVPDSHEDDPKPLPNEDTLRAVCTYLDARRLLTTELYVVAPTYREVEIEADLVVGDQADLAEVKVAAEEALLTYFHPLTGGEDGLGWPFGGDIYYSRVAQQLFSLTGVDRIGRLAIVVDGETAPPCTDVAIDQGLLVFSTQHHINVTYDFSE